MPTLEIYVVLESTGMFSPRRVIPFYTKPLAFFASDFTNIADGTSVALSRQSLARVEG